MVKTKQKVSKGIPKDVLEIMENYRRDSRCLPQSVWFKDGEEFAQGEIADMQLLEVEKSNHFSDNHNYDPDFRIKQKQLLKEIYSVCKEKYL